ncbi:MAG TPA: Ig-like domain-containing protein, partial [Longimicrobium sp.]|nr:Ig-like domain-containing protein [Longimicrobium sp.]
MRPGAAQQPGAPWLRGDVNGDGAVTAADAQLVLAYVVGRPIPDGSRTGRSMDADGNGRVTTRDALVIRHFAAGNDVSGLPVGRPLAFIAVVPDSGSLFVGGTLRLRAVVTGAADTLAAWTSDAPEVATVDASGVVSALAPGSAVVTAVARADTSQKAHATIRVALVPVARLELLPALLLLGVGDSVRLVATLRDAAGNLILDRPLAWSSAAARFATVTDSGTVRGVEPGTAPVIATAEGMADTTTVEVHLGAARLNAAGGVVRTPGGAVQVRVPAGSLGDSAWLTLDAASPVPPGGSAALGGPFVFGPATLALSRGATAEAHYETAQLPAGTTAAEL